MRAWRRTLLVQDNENPVNIMWKMQKRAILNWYSNGQVDIVLVKNEFQSISSWIESKSVWKSWKKSGMQLFANTKLVKNKYFTYIWPPKEVANWWKGQMPLCSRTQWIFESLADQNSEFLCWRFQFCAQLTPSNEKYWQKGTRKFYSQAIWPSFSRPSTQEGRGTWLYLKWPIIWCKVALYWPLLLGGAVSIILGN